MAYPQVASVGANATGTAGITIPLPEGWIENDILLCVVTSANQTITVPSGWTDSPMGFQGQGTAAAATGVGVRAFWKRATASETDVAVADSGNFTMGTMFAIRNAITTGDPFDTAFAVTNVTTADTAIVCPAITTGTDNSLVIHGCVSDNDLASTAHFPNPITNATLLYAQRCHGRTVATGAGGGFGLYTGPMVTAGSTGTATGTLDASIAHLDFTLAIKPATGQVAPTYFGNGAGVGGSAGITVDLPVGGWVENDILVIFAHTANENFPTSPPTGWSAVPTPASGTGTAGTAGAIKLHVFWKRATASESAVSLGDSGNYSAARMLSFSHAITTGDPWDIDGTSLQSTTSTALSFPSITTTVDNCAIIMAVAGDFDPASNLTDAMFSGGYTAGSGITALDKTFDASFATATGGEYGVFYGIQRTAGSTGTTSATLANTQVFTTWIGALKPIPSGTAYNQTCYSTGSGSVSLTDALTVSSVLSSTGSGAVTLGKSISKILAATGSGVASVIKEVVLAAKTFSGVGSSSLSPGLLMNIASASTGSGAASMFKRIGIALASVGSGTAAYSSTTIPGAPPEPGISNAFSKPIYVLSDVTGLRAWVDYLPVKQKIDGRTTSFSTYNDDGNLSSRALTSVTGLTPWVDYIPVATSYGPEAKRWRYDDDGWLSLSDTYPD